MNLILGRCYVIVMTIIFTSITLVTWPIILLLQLHPVTRDWYYANIFALICKVCSILAVSPKQKLFDTMTKDFKELSLSESGKAIRVLEIGPGTGDNFKYYKSPIQLTTVDLNPFLKETAMNLSAKYPLVEIVESHVANAESMTCFEDNSFDIVCGTLIMCCIKDNKAALAEIHRVLKPNGRYYYLEGNRMQPNRSVFYRSLEWFLSIIWVTCEYGCKFLHNNFDEKLKSSKLVTDRNVIYETPECFMGHELHYGCAIKA